MQVERHKHLAIALEIAPDHPAVHGLLGQVVDKGEWRMPEAVVEDYPRVTPRRRRRWPAITPAATRVPIRPRPNGNWRSGARRTA